MHVRTLVVAALLALGLALTGCTIYTGPQQGRAYATQRGYGPAYYRTAQSGDCQCRCPSQVAPRGDDYGEQYAADPEERPIDPYERAYPAPRSRSRFGDRPEDWLE